MYEAPGKARISQLAIRKSPSMPMLDIAIIGGDASATDSSSRCPLSSGRKAMPSTPLHRKLKSAVSLCVGILVCTVVLFVLVALDPSKVAEEPWRGGPRMRVALPKYRHWASHENATEGNPLYEGRPEAEARGLESGAALEGMGTLFRRGTRGMPQLVVAHLAESTAADELRLFLRGLHRSGIPAHSDVVLLFPHRPVAAELMAVVREEEIFFQKLVGIESPARAPDAPEVSAFNGGAYTRIPPLGSAELTGVRQDSIWGRRRNATFPIAKTVEAPELQPVAQVVDETPHYGAVVGFDVQELDPDDALSGFIRSPPMHLRRWLCYQMLLGMVRHRYRHVLVTEVTGVVILNDALLASLKLKDSSQLHLYATAQSWSQTLNPNPSANSTTNATLMERVYGSRIWNSLDDEAKGKKVISTGVILGGIRPVRSVAAAMATEIVRVALLRKSRECFRDEALLSYLVHKSSALGRKVVSHMQVHESGTSAVNLLPSSRDFFGRNESPFALIHGLQSESVSSKQSKKILESWRRNVCQALRDREVYADCFTEAEEI